MKKRMLLLGMAIWMAAALTGCGNDTTDSTEQATEADQEQSENATDKTQTDGSQTDANIEQAATGAPMIQMEKQQKDWHSDDGSKWLMHAETQRLQVDIPGNDAATKKINDWSEADASTFWENAEKTSEYAENDLESMSTVSGMEDLGTYSYYYSSFQSYNVIRADSQVISLRSYNNDYAGGVHGDYAYYGTTGPMDFIPQYIKGKNDASSISYDCPQLEPILNSTYGCIVYQEQVMQIVRDLAGYSLGRSDLLRRAMSKKKGEEMKRERQIFLYGDEASGIPGCVKNGIDEQVANKIYDEMLDFANYAFNKSHAAAYAVVAYQTAWLKYYYPVEYMAALMTSVIDNPSKVAEYIYASRQMGIQILPPDINNGEADFSVDEGNIRYGLSAIKSVGRPVVRPASGVMPMEVSTTLP